MIRRKREQKNSTSRDSFRVKKVGTAGDQGDVARDRSSEDVSPGNFRRNGNTEESKSEDNLPGFACFASFLFNDNADSEFV
ncbi:unnamed protein product [Sphenostylis stenocarpa]|uniref:Uncharacterized protein n=1 Tax=Sphenostylis stenocarpa TaxID=92480 RepID=A0AA86RUS8_9FABA|nr:unnamed protein product [Sphenostylis stenocarpa]